MRVVTVSLERLGLAEQILANGVTDGLYTHAAYALARGGKVVGQKGFGAARADAIFDLASLTKPMVTAVLCLQAAEQGALHLRQSAAAFFESEFGVLPHLESIEIRHLLTHTSGLPPIPRWQSTPPEDRKALIKYVLTTPLLRAPGTSYTYSDTGYILLGEIISRLSGKGLAATFAETVAAPLGLTATGFGVARGQTERVVPTALHGSPGIVHDPRARDLGGVAGHAGLFGTVSDILIYAEAVRAGGLPILSPAATARMQVSQIPSSVGSHSYGWFCSGNDFLPQGDFFSDRAFGHSGFTGTMILIDPEYETSLILLTNRVINAEEDGSRFLRLRRFWLNAVAAALL